MIRLTVDKSDRQFIKPRQIERAGRLAINEVTRDIHRELGGEIPRKHGTSVTGYRRVRSKKTLAKARRKRVAGTVWQGTMKIQAIYAGKPRKTKGGIKAGKHFFPNAFVRTFKSGHEGIFHRVNGDIEEVKIDLPHAHALAKRKADEKLRDLPSAFRKHYRKQIKRK